jgi:type IV pilus assembly protein PilB
MNKEVKIQDILRGFTLDLVESGILTKKVAQESLQQAIKDKMPFVHYLVEKKLVVPLLLALAVAKYFGLPILSLSSFNPASIPQDLLGQLTAKQKRYAIPLFKRGDKLFVAVADPTIAELQEIKFNTKLDVVPIIVEADKLFELLSSMAETQEIKTLDEMKEIDLSKIETVIGKEEEQEITELDVEDAPIVKFVNKVFSDAIKQGASDVHFEPYEKIYRLRYRIDGILYEIAKHPLYFANRVAARIKIMAKLNIAERRIPQDGRFRLNLSKARAIDFRVSTCPVTGGEKVVTRLLDPLTLNIEFDKLGFSEEQKKRFSEVIHYPQGMILVTGPTGSGKTITLYTALNMLNTIDKNICTAENPVEINLEGINQVDINPAINLTFANSLRAFLRQDPDIIMIGEVRDLETAEIAIKAAQTGHLVLSTVHTNSAAETLTRLIDIGVERFDIASSISMIIAQRLARRLCKHCKKEQHLPDEVLLREGFSKDELKTLKLYEAGECEHCIRGYKGRVGIFEIVNITKPLKQAILSGANALELEEMAVKEGAELLRKAGLDKVREGIISLEELNRVIKV